MFIAGRDYLNRLKKHSRSKVLLGIYSVKHMKKKGKDQALDFIKVLDSALKHLMKPLMVHMSIKNAHSQEMSVLGAEF